MLTPKDAWATLRPLYSRLPVAAYRDNPLADALTVWADEKLTDKRLQLEGFHEHLDPLTCPSEALDYLGYLVGMSGAFWDSEWSDGVKRQMISQAHLYVWRFRGTLGVVKAVLTIHGFEWDIWLDGSLTLPFEFSGSFGSQKLRYYVRLPIQYARSSSEFREAIRTVKNYSPVHVDARVCYQGFVFGFSRIGEPLFV
jgi:phage tail P2-like protein